MIHCSNLTKDYKSFKKTGWLKLRRSKSAEVFRAVDNITFDIGAGEVVGYIGPNGAGKSTTIKMMCGILTPTSGELTVNGLVPYKNRQKNARQIGVIFGQKSQLWWDLPITSSLKLYQKMYEIPDDVYHERYMQLCDMLELDEFADRPVRTLSLGQRMRGELAAAVLHWLVAQFRSVVRYPLNIYPFFIQAICTFLLPYAFINYFPSLLLFEKIGMTEGIVLFCCGILVSALMVALPVWMFSRGLRRYESGNG